MRRVALLIGVVGAILGACFVTTNLVPSFLLTRRGPDADLAVFAVGSQVASLALCLLGALGVRLAVAGRPEFGTSLTLIAAYGPVISVLACISLLPRIAVIPGFDPVYPGPPYYAFAGVPVLASLAASALLLLSRG